MTATIQTPAVSSSLMAAVNGPAASATTTTQAAEDRFMTLLVTQMKNQDPLNPLDNAQVTSQLAQLSTVTGIDKLNTTLEGLSSSYQSSQSIEAASMIGKSVLVPGSTMALKSGSGAFGIDLAADAASVKVAILDASGHAVSNIDLGKQSAGTAAFQWDGKTDAGTTAADGAYTIQISAANGKDPVTATALSLGQVDSVTRNTAGVKLNVANVGAVDLSSVKQIL